MIISTDKYTLMKSHIALLEKRVSELEATVERQDKYIADINKKNNNIIFNNF